MVKKPVKHEDEPEEQEDTAEPEAPAEPEIPPGGSQGNTGQAALNPDDLLTAQEVVAHDEAKAAKKEEKAAEKEAKAEEKAAKKAAKDKDDG